MTSRVKMFSNICRVVSAVGCRNCNSPLLESCVVLGWDHFGVQVSHTKDRNMDSLPLSHTLFYFCIFCPFTISLPINSTFKSTFRQLALGYNLLLWVIYLFFPNVLNIFYQKIKNLWVKRKAPKTESVERIQFSS